MTEVGKYNTLPILRSVDFGVYLDGGELGEILLPQRYLPEGSRVGDAVEVFVYYDSEDRVIATTERPYAQVGEFAVLKVNSVNPVGVFLDWGLASKELLVPFREQRAEMFPGKYYVVYLYVDEVSGRIVATAKINRFLQKTPVDYTLNQEVSLLVTQETELGFKVIVDNAHWGMIYHNEIFKPVHRGDRLAGYVTHIRADEKVDVALQPVGYGGVDSLAQGILDAIRKNDGFLRFNDKSDAGEIAAAFGCSKKNFKKAVGALYRQRLIEILDDGIRLVK